MTRGAKAWKDPEFREKSRSLARRRYAQVAEVRERQVKKAREWRAAHAQDPEYKARRAAAMRAYRQRCASHAKE